MRLANLADQLIKLGMAVDDVGNVAVPDRASLPSVPRARLAAITEVCEDIARRTAAAVRDGVRPLVIGGDHSLAAGSVATKTAVGVCPASAICSARVWRRTRRS